MGISEIMAHAYMDSQDAKIHIFKAIIDLIGDKINISEYEDLSNVISKELNIVLDNTNKRVILYLDNIAEM